MTIILQLASDFKFLSQKYMITKKNYYYGFSVMFLKTAGNKYEMNTVKVGCRAVSKIP